MKAEKSLGQHWLQDEDSLNEITKSASIKAGETVLEIGPGTGLLTEKLLNSGSKVVAVEVDQRLIENLKLKYTTLPLKLNKLSILDFDFSSLPDNYKIVSNIPYNITNQIIRMLTETQHKPLIAVLLVQKEVAQRLSAKPGDMGLNSVVLQMFYYVTTGREVKADLFLPAPKVDSQILILNRRQNPLFDNVTVSQIIKLSKICFKHRRKTLLNSLSAGLNQTKDAISKNMKLARININARPQDLSLVDWSLLAKEIFN